MFLIFRGGGEDTTFEAKDRKVRGQGLLYKNELDLSLLTSLF